MAQAEEVIVAWWHEHLAEGRNGGDVTDPIGSKGNHRFPDLFGLGGSRNMSQDVAQKLTGARKL